jgi:hypothetical protein
MDAYNLFATAIAGASGGLFYWAIRNRQRALARVKARIRRR